MASFQAIGTLLVFGLLIGPPATASLLVRRVPLIMVTAVALGAVAVVLGLAISYHHDTAGGATIAGLAVAEFFVVLAAQEATSAVRHGPPPPRGLSRSSDRSVERRQLAVRRRDVVADDDVVDRPAGGRRPPRPAVVVQGQARRTDPLGADRRLESVGQHRPGRRRPDVGEPVRGRGAAPGARAPTRPRGRSTRGQQGEEPARAGSGT